MCFIIVSLFTGLIRVHCENFPHPVASLSVFLGNNAANAQYFIFVQPKTVVRLASIYKSHLKKNVFLYPNNYPQIKKCDSLRNLVTPNLLWPNPKWASSQPARSWEDLCLHMYNKYNIDQVDHFIKTNFNTQSGIQYFTKKKHLCCHATCTSQVDIAIKDREAMLCMSLYLTGAMNVYSM